jgi:hypothetical protein
MACAEPQCLYKGALYIFYLTMDNIPSIMERRKEIIIQSNSIPLTCRIDSRGQITKAVRIQEYTGTIQ